MGKIKDFLFGTLGLLGMILYLLVNVLLAFVPVYILPIPFWVTFIIVFVGMWAPTLFGLISPIFYGWAMYVVLTEPFHWTHVVYWISFGIWLLTSFIPTIINLLPKRKSANDDEKDDDIEWY